MAMLQLLINQCGSLTTNATKAIGIDCYDERHLIRRSDEKQ